jgi:hypothetical protein
MSDQTDDDLEGLLDQVDEGAVVDTKELPNAVAVSSGGTVVPLHAVTGANIKRGPGRPKKVNPKPTVDDLSYHAEISRQRQVYVDTDTLVRTAVSRQEAVDTLQNVKEQVAREAASLSFTKNEEEKYGRDTSQISSRRIAALRDIAHIELEIRKLGVSMIDLRSERFTKIFKFFLQNIREAASKVMSTEQLDLFVNQLETQLDGWEDKAQNL